MPPRGSPLRWHGWERSAGLAAGRLRCDPRHMKHLGITLSDDHRAFLDDQVAHGGYADIGEYIAALIDADARAKAQARLEELLLEGLEGEPTEWTEADTERLERLAVNGR